MSVSPVMTVWSTICAFSIRPASIACGSSHRRYPSRTATTGVTFATASSAFTPVCVSAETAQQLAGAPDYFPVATAAIRAM